MSEKEEIVERFYLHLRRGETTVAPDDEGAEFASIEEAYLETFKGAQELWPELIRNRQDPRQYSYDITDEDGAVLMDLPFTEIVECCRRVGPASRSASPKERGAALNQRAFSDALENARSLNEKTAELCAQLRAAKHSIQELKEAARSTIGG